MNRFWITSLLMATLSCVSITAYSDDIETAQAAYEKEDYVSANKIYENLANKGNPEALEYIGWNYLAGMGGFERNERLGNDYLKKALDNFIKLASKGNAKAQYRLGNLYSDETSSKHFGVELSKEESDKWYQKGIAGFQKAADKGDLEALTALAQAYELGKGVAQNANKAFELYKQAAQQYTPAKEKLGYWLSKMDDPKYISLGIEYLEDASKNGSRQAKQDLYWIYSTKGNDYSEGRNNVAKDVAKAFDNYLKAATMGSTINYDNNQSILKVGEAYYFGNGTYQDKEKAAYWFQKAATLGDRSAQYNFGVMLVNGDGIGKNYLRGYILLNIAAGKGEKRAASLRDKIEPMLSPQDIGEGQRKASEWKKWVDL